MYPKTIQKLIELFSKFPTVGPKTAARFVFYLLKLSNEEIKELNENILDLKKLKICQNCFLPFDEEKCPICEDSRRDKSILCVVEKETDLKSIEATKKYNGLYFILGGLFYRFKQDDAKNLRTKELLKKANNPEVKEIIIAINPTTEGEATALFVERLLKPIDKKTTKLGRGLPVGAELEYADSETISSALEGRK